MSKNPRGAAIIINNQTFVYPEMYPFRDGADVDANNLEKLFSQLDFEVSKHTNLTRNATLKLMIDMADAVGSKPCDMLIVCILSHGKDQGKIVSSDGLMIDMETDIFR